MDQLREILRPAIKYRFWIAVGISALLPIIAYLVGSGPIQAKAEAETKAIKDAKKNVERYANGQVPNRQYRPLVEEKTAILAKDVTASWKKLYHRQAPLLTWPERVQERLRTWGRKWPENEDASRVQVAIIDYVTDYPKYVDEVYNSFHPFDVATGKGIVAAPPKETLLRPAQFKINELPDLGKVWAAQERLWIQRTLLEVIADVNKNAKDWDTAIVRQINKLEVGNATAQDQKSLAKGEELEEAPAITDPKAPPPADTAAPTGRKSRGGGGPNAMMTMVMGGGTNQKPDSVSYIKSQTQSPQYKILPLQLSVLVEQDHIPDFLVGLENSPMAIQVMEVELAKPSTRVVKPEKGEALNFAGSGGANNTTSMMAMYQRMQGGGPGVSGFGGNQSMRMMRMMMGRVPSYGPGMESGALGPSGTQRTGVDKRAVVRAEERKKREEEQSQTTTKHRTHDQYFNLIEVTIYGQARFYNPPPAEPNLAEGTAPAHPHAARAEEAKPTRTESTRAEARAPKTEAPKPEPENARAEATKSDAEKGKSEVTTAKGDVSPASEIRGTQGRTGRGDPQEMMAPRQSYL